MAKREKVMVKEETLAGSSLHPAARPVTDDPKSRFETIAAVIGSMHAMRDEELTKWYEQSIANLGHEADIVGDNSESNKDTLAMKPSHAEGSGRAGKEGMPTLAGGGQPASDAGKTLPEKKMSMPKISVKEDVEELFNGQELSEEFKTNATTLFEAAVTARVILESTRIHEEYQTQLNEAIEAATDEITDKVDAYLNYAVDNWMTENELAIESSIRNDLMEGFIHGLRDLFNEHDIAIPESQVDSVEALVDQVAALEFRLNEAIEQNAKLNEVLEEAAIKEAVVNAAESLTVAEQHKFYALAEGVDFDGDFDLFNRKLSVIRENYFRKAPGNTNLEEETFEGQTTSTEVSSGYSEVDSLVKVLDRSVKR